MIEGAFNWLIGRYISLFPPAATFIAACLLRYSELTAENFFGFLLVLYVVYTAILGMTWFMNPAFRQADEIRFNPWLSLAYGSVLGLVYLLQTR